MFSFNLTCCKMSCEIICIFYYAHVPLYFIINIFSWKGSTLYLIFFSLCHINSIMVVRDVRHWTSGVNVHNENSDRTGSHLPNISDVKSRKRRKTWSELTWFETSVLNCTEANMCLYSVISTLFGNYNFIWKLNKNH
jgi:hypothetical protein